MTAASTATTRMDDDHDDGVVHHLSSRKRRRERRRRSTFRFVVIIIVFVFLINFNIIPNNNNNNNNSNNNNNGVSATVIDEDTNNCADEFENCVTNRDCCGHIECITGDWQYTTDSTCLSERSRTLDMQTKGLKLNVNEIIISLKDYIYQHSSITISVQQEDEEIFFSKIAYKYRHDIPKLIVKLEKKYNIKDLMVIPNLMDDFIINNNDDKKKKEQQSSSSSSSSEL